jgi:hypothetical protein
MKDDQKFINNKLKYLYNTLEINIFGIEDDNNEENNYRKLVFHKSVFDDCLEGDLKFKKDFLNRHKNFDIVYNHDDISFYVFNKDIFILLENDRIKKKNLLKTDFVPFLINKSYKKILRKLLYGAPSKKKPENPTKINNDNISTSILNTERTKTNKKVDIMALVLEDSEENYA